MDNRSGWGLEVTPEQLWPGSAEKPGGARRRRAHCRVFRLAPEGHSAPRLPRLLQGHPPSRGPTAGGGSLEHTPPDGQAWAVLPPH